MAVGARNLEQDVRKIGKGSIRMLFNDFYFTYELINPLELINILKTAHSDKLGDDDNKMN
jgi:hypothetical protein